MSGFVRSKLRGALAVALVAGTSTWAAQGSAQPSDAPTVGVKVRAGGRYDDVRMCVASPAGTPGGPAADIAFYSELPIGENRSFTIDLPVMRPVLFGAAFQMLQFEPEVGILLRHVATGSVDFLMGPTLGLSLHYGPDYHSGTSDEERGPDFFALGPRLGTTLAFDFKRPGRAFNFALGAHPYLTLLTAIDDPERHRGVVVGGTLDGLFRFQL